MVHPHRRVPVSHGYPGKVVLIPTIPPNAANLPRLLRAFSILSNAATIANGALRAHLLNHLADTGLNLLDVISYRYRVFAPTMNECPHSATEEGIFKYRYSTSHVGLVAEWQK